jgi:hypothetical protein
MIEEVITTIKKAASLWTYLVAYFKYEESPPEELMRN